jgi:catechol 2,3-dioxygenase-like lactoylglutathione lyase family enzyme
MSTIRVEDIAHVRFTAPDLEVMRQFLEDFGLTTELSRDGILYARGIGPAPFLHTTSPGDAGFSALGLRAKSVDQLKLLADAENVEVQTLNAPGGGFVVQLVDPDGYRIEVVSGQEIISQDPYPTAAPHNDAREKHRKRETLRLDKGPANVVRLGHAVLEVRDFRVSEQWYKERFGFITSDEIELAPGTALGAFLRCDCGDQPTDHHTLFLLQSPDEPKFNHAAFEVLDYDDLMCGHTHLQGAKRAPTWGVGRHVLGSQIFDYWLDPWGHELEHWTDGDLLTASDGSNIASIDDLLNVQWGPQHPMAKGAT